MMPSQQQDRLQRRPIPDLDRHYDAVRAHNVAVVAAMQENAARIFAQWMHASLSVRRAHDGRCRVTHPQRILAFLAAHLRNCTAAFARMEVLGALDEAQRDALVARCWPVILAIDLTLCAFRFKHFNTSEIALLISTSDDLSKVFVDGVNNLNSNKVNADTLTEYAHNKIFDHLLSTYSFQQQENQQQEQQQDQDRLSEYDRAFQKYCQLTGKQWKVRRNPRLLMVNRLMTMTGKSTLRFLMTTTRQYEKEMRSEPHLRQLVQVLF